MSSQPWVDHFKSSVGRSSPWSTKSKMVLLKRGGLNSAAVNTRSLPLNVVSPTEQFAEMAQASIDKNTPKYASPSVARHTGRGAGGQRARRRERSSHKNKRRSESKKKEKNKSSKKKKKRSKRETSRKNKSVDKSSRKERLKKKKKKRKELKKTQAAVSKSDIFS